MPACQTVEQCGRCFDLVLELPARTLDCGHLICNICDDEESKECQERPLKSKGTEQLTGTCVFKRYEDWYDIHVVPDTVTDPSGIDDTDSKTPGPLVRGRRPLIGCRLCQSRVFQVKDPEKARAMPIIKNLDLVIGASEPKQCETDDEHDSVTPDATYWCMTCHKYVCKNCARQFHSILDTIDGDVKECRVFSLKVMSGEMPIGSEVFMRQQSNKVTGCTKHNGAEQTHFCRRCKRLVCDLCLQDPSSHAKHPVEVLQLAVQAIREQTQSDVDKLADLHDEIKKQKRCISFMKEEKLKQFEKMDAGVDEWAAELIAKIERAKQGKKEEIDRERRRCLLDIDQYEKSLEEAEVNVWTFGEAIHTILNEGFKGNDMPLNRSVLVQKCLSSNHKVFHSLRVPPESTSLKRMLYEKCEFRQNGDLLESIEPESLGRIVVENRATFQIHEYNLSLTPIRHGGNHSAPSLDLSSVEALDGGHIVLTRDRSSESVMLLFRRSPDVCEYEEVITRSVKKPICVANMGHEFILVLSSKAKLTLVSYSGATFQLPKNCGPPKYKICSITCVDGTLYFGCYDTKTREGRGVICCQDFKFNSLVNPKKCPFEFSVLSEYCRIGNGEPPHCLSAQRKMGLQMAIGQPPDKIVMTRNKSNVTATLEGGMPYKVLDVCFDQDGDVLVADGYHVLLYGTDGKLKGIVVGPENGIEQPVAIAISDTNDLIIADRKFGLKTFVYKKKNLREVEFSCKI